MQLARLADKADAYLISLSKRAFAFACVLIAATFSIKSLVQGNLLDADDYIYLVQSMDWFKGQNWFDMVQHRMDPPSGSYVPYSHFLTGFYGSLIYIFHFFYTKTTAAIIVAAIVPVFYLILYLTVMHWLGESLIFKKRVELTDFIILFSPSLLFQFSAGHIDHHGLEILLALTTLAFLMFMIKQPKKIRWPILAGITLAFGLVAGLEILPFLLVATAWAGIMAMIEGKRAAQNGMIFALSLFISSVVFLALTRSPTTFFDLDIQAYSITYILLTAGVVLCFFGIALADRTKKKPIRLVTGIGLAVGTGLCFLYCFPELMIGPYGGAAPVIRKLIWDSASESTPLLKSQNLGMGAIIWPLMALVLSGFYCVQEKIPWQRWIWGLYFLVLAACIPLSVFYQCRFQTYVETFSVLPIACAIQRDWEAIARPKTFGDILRLARFIILIIAGPLALHLFIAPNAGAEDSHEAGISAQTTGTWGCDLHGVAAILNDPRHYGDRTRLIMNSMNQGPELLFLTQHNVLAAPVHTDTNGNIDALDFFTTYDPAKAKSIVKRRGADLVIFCTLPGQIVAYMPDGKNASTPNFTQQLINGNTPKWLKPIRSPDFGDLMVFEVHI